jgi:hypothetical protein
MAARVLILLGNAYVLLYAVDASSSLVEGTISNLTGSAIPGLLRNAVASAVVLNSLLVLPGIVLTPRLPPSVFVPLALSALWLNSSAAPLPLWLEQPTLDSTMVGIQLAFATAAFLRIRALSGGRSWLLEAAPERPAFSLVHSLVALCVFVLGGTALVLAYLPLWVLTSIQTMTEGFVRLDATGISLADRVYERDDERVRLVGMMHIGESDAYEAVVESMAGPRSVVLTEGVTDRDLLLEEGLSYEGVASALGLDTQRSLETYFERLPTPERGQWPEVRHADVDLSDFHPDTITWLTYTARMWSGDDPLAAFSELYRRFSEDPERWSVFQADVLTRRNQHLLEEIRSALGEYDRVIVPWGALHLPFVEQNLLEMHFEATSRTHHPLTSWATIAAALWRPGTEEAAADDSEPVDSE